MRASQQEAKDPDTSAGGLDWDSGHQRPRETQSKPHFLTGMNKTREWAQPITGHRNYTEKEAASGKAFGGSGCRLI